MQEREQEHSSVAHTSPSISEIFTSKATTKEMEPTNLPLDLLSALDHINKSESSECELCQDWLPGQEELDCHLREKHGITQQAGLDEGKFPEASAILQKVQGGKQNSSSFVEAAGCSNLQKFKPGKRISKNHIQKHFKIRISSLDQAELEESEEGPTKVKKAKKPKKSNSRSNVGKLPPSRRSRPDHSCAVCSLKFLSRYKLEQHLNTTKHLKAVARINASAGKVEKAGRGRKAKQRICSVCQITTSSVKELKQHMKEHKGVNKGYSEPSKNLCRECGTLVATKSLKRHEKRCANRKRFECPLCKHQSRERTDYNHHIDNHRVFMDTKKLPDSTGKRCRSDDKQISSEDKEAADSILATDGSTSLQSLSPTDLAVLGLLRKQENESTSDLMIQLM